MINIPVVYIPEFINAPDLVFKTLRNELNWVHRDSVPRLEYYVNELEVPYTYGSGDFSRTYEPQPTHPFINLIGQKLEDETGAHYEICFLNRYIDQSDHLGWHADDSPEMDDDRPICILSFGVEREIWFRRKDEPDQIIKLKLEHGSLCIMKPGMQDTHYHRIPKAGFMCGERISMTYRGYKG